MTNGEKYTAAKERAEAFWKWYTGDNLPYYAVDAFAHWLDLEAEEEEPLPCPFCGSKTSAIEHPNTGYCWVMCENGECHYSAGYADSEESAIAAHNRVARAVAKDKEAK